MPRATKSHDYRDALELPAAAAVDMIGGLAWSAWLLLLVAVVPGLAIVTNALLQYARRKRHNRRPSDIS